MLNRKLPRDIENFVPVDADLSRRLHLIGFSPYAMVDEKIYYRKSKLLLKAIDKILKCSI